MKITYLQLKNFASIYVSMRKKKIEIDFSKSKNNIILLVGENGSGKTSILSALHPFAYPGNMDVRNNTNLILEGEDGYKEIWIEVDDVKYTIQHFYKSMKKQVSVKSFIQKDGEELNPNGNVRSFNETVKLELSLEPDYLKLLRLGSNVTNLIEMKSAERKNFTSDLLSDINVYNELYKKINEDAKLLRNLTKSVTDKIDKLNVIDSELLIKEISDIEKELTNHKMHRERLQHKSGSIDGKISVIVPEGMESFNKELESLNNDVKSNTYELNRLRDRRSKYSLIMTTTIDKYLISIQDSISEIMTKIMSNDAMLIFYKNELNEICNKRDKVHNELKYISTDLEYAQLSNLQIELVKKRDVYKTKFSKYIPNDSKDNMLVMLNILIEMNKIAHTIYEFDNQAVNEFVRLFKDGINIDSYIKEEMAKIDRKISKSVIDVKHAEINNDVVVLFRPQGCTFDECPYLDLHNRLFGTDDDTTSDGKESLIRQKEILTILSDINRNFEYILIILRSNADIINKTNITYFKLNNIVDAISNRHDIYNENILTEYISDIEEYEEYKSLDSKIKEIDYELSKINSNKSNIDKLTAELKDLNTQITRLEETIRYTENEKNNNTIEVESLKNLYDDAIDYRDICNDIDNIANHIVQINYEISSMNDKLTELSDLLEDKETIDNDMRTLLWNIEKLEKDIFDKTFILKEFENLSKERRILNEKFEDINIIREALSSNKGIPLLFIQLYLKNSKMYVNQLLEMVYGDSFEIDDFEINSSEFNIPYIKNGIRINDVVYASQGERSFLSLALSFALINQSIKDYNILLLDEIDSTLDTHNRSMFLSILEKQMDVIDAEQVFLITHNNMFDNYPVDVILTSDITLDNYKNANIIYS